MKLTKRIKVRRSKGRFPTYHGNWQYVPSCEYIALRDTGRCESTSGLLIGEIGRLNVGLTFQDGRRK